MRVDAYRLWQHWQQMHYPRRGLPAEEAARAELVSLDGTAGTVLDRYFGGRTPAREMDAEARKSLERCKHDLDFIAATLAGDASRYFGRLHQLLDTVLSEANAAHTNRKA
jgi:hypothetical protein